ncbi:MAG TPA: hypothetical protein VFZ11_11425 [Gemmatimonadaceae bacterium]
MSARYLLWMRRLGGPALAIVLFAVAVRALRAELGGQGVGDVLEQLAALPSWRIALALLLTAASYGALTGYDALSLRYVRRPLPYRRIALASFVNYAVSQTLGFPLLTGGSVRYRLYSGWGLGPAQVASVVAFASLSFWLGVLLLGGLGLLLGAPRELAAMLRLSPPAQRIVGLAALSVVGAYLWWTVAGSRILRLGTWRLLRPSARLGLSQLAVAAVDWMLAASVLYVLLPPSLGISFPAFLAVFLVAFVSGIASNVPAGLGVFETVFLLLLPEDASHAAVLGALVAYRALYYLLPLLVALTLLGAHEVRLARRERTGLPETRTPPIGEA